MNVFQHTYELRLREWHNLRLSIQDKDIETVCVAVDHWWQQVPLVNHHLHPFDQENWPDPWTMLSDNTYCTLTRGIGMCYTLLMCGIVNIKLVTAMDELCEDHNLVVVDDTKYVLNYHPNSVLSTTLRNFKVTGELQLDILQKHIK